MWEMFVEESGGRDIVFVMYMNFYVDLKVFCVFYGGFICIFLNVVDVFEWVFECGDVVLFLFDKYFGCNMVDDFGIDGVVEWDLWVGDVIELMGVVDELDFDILEFGDVEVIFWDGYC